MATRAFTIQRVETFKDDCHVITWTGLTFATTDDGAPLEMPGSADRSVQVIGTLGTGGSLRIEGSNDGTNWAALNDPQGNTLDINTLKIEQVLDLTRYIRPRVTAGDGTTNLSVIMLVRRPFL